MREVVRAAPDLRHGDRRDAEQRALHGGADGAGVGDVVAEVRALVDAGHHQRRPLPRRMPLMRQVDAVGRRAVDRVAVGRRPRRCAAAGAGVSAWLTALCSRSGATTTTRAERLQRVGQRAEPVGVDAVVVGDQDERRRGPSTARGSVPPRRRRCKHACVASAAPRIGASRFERPTTRTPSECATWLRHAPVWRDLLGAPPPRVKAADAVNRPIRLRSARARPPARCRRSWSS